jgi:hypothetical protein
MTWAKVWSDQFMVATMYDICSHELRVGSGQKVQDPQIGLALIRRSLSAQLDMAAGKNTSTASQQSCVISASNSLLQSCMIYAATNCVVIPALGLPEPAKVKDLLDNLVPYNTVTTGNCNLAIGTAQCGNR